jgi:exonuclease III
VASYNINGTRGILAAVLAQAKQARIDILLLQELHLYENGEHVRVGATADRIMVHSPATRSDPSSGVAIVVRNDSTSVVPIVASARSVIASRYITMQCTINGTQQTISSVYLSAQTPVRKSQLHAIIKSKILN